MSRYIDCLNGEYTLKTFQKWQGFKVNDKVTLKPEYFKENGVNSLQMKWQGRLYEIVAIEEKLNYGNRSVVKAFTLCQVKNGKTNHSGFLYIYSSLYLEKQI